MATQIYRCPIHEEFEVSVPIEEDVPEERQCLEKMQGSGTLCFRTAYWVPSAPNFIGGPTTGAQNK